MIDPEIIIEEAKKPESKLNYNLFELNLYLAIKNVLLLYSAKNIPKEVASRYKTKAVSTYKNSMEQFEFWKEIMQRHINISQNTEAQRTKLHKLLHQKSPDNAEIINTCMKIICIDYGKEFEYWEKMK